MKKKPARVPRETLAFKIDALALAFSEFTTGHNGTPGAFERFRDIEKQFEFLEQTGTARLTQHMASPIHSVEAYDTLVAVGAYVANQNAKAVARKEFWKAVRKYALQGVVALLGSGSVGYIAAGACGIIK